MAALLVLWPVTGGAAVYTAIDLHPAGFAQSAGQGISGGRQVGNAYGGSLNASTAIVWHGSSASATALDASGYTRSVASAIDGDQIVGWVRPAQASNDQSVIWNATDGSIVASLHNAQVSSQSYVQATQGGHQVGTVNSPDHAALWAGSSASYINLHPAGFARTGATGVYGGKQIGYGHPDGPGVLRPAHALLWSGSATSYVDLNPFGANGSAGWGMYGDQQVGSWNATSGSQQHAVLWRGTAGSAVDLHPVGWIQSYAFATNGVQQVGLGIPPGASFGQAMLWNSTSADFVNLHALLPPDFYTSRADGIDQDGNVIGTATLPIGITHAVMWAVPEPTGATFAAVAVLLLTRRRTGAKRRE